MKIIVAYDLNKIIGTGGKLPWKCEEDLQFFKELTTDSTVIMGRRTWESLPVKPLPNRTNIILASGMKALDLRQKYPTVQTFNSFSRLLNNSYQGNDTIDHNAFIIGGGQVYKAALELDCVDEAYITLFPKIYKCGNGGDVLFPTLKGTWNIKEQWKIKDTKGNSKDNYYRFRLTKDKSI